MRRIESAHIVSDGSPVHDKGVSEIVEGKLAPSKTGAAIFALIRAHGWVVVRPYNQGDFNARARVNPELEWLKGQPGLVAEIEFSSSTFAHVIWVKGVPLPNPRAIVFPGFEADEVLLHELVHAARALSGDFDAAAMKGAMAPYDTEEEFVAIMVANIYISEKGKPAVFLRRSHSTEATGLAEKDTDPEIFLYKDDNYRLVKKFCDQHPRVSRMVADVPAKFNPVRAYYDTTTLTIKEDIDVPVPYRVKQSYERPPLTDDYLIRLLKPRYREDDVAGYGARARKLEQVFGNLKVMEAAPLMVRLELRPFGDKVAMYFHAHLATATRTKLLGIVRNRVTKV